LDKEYNKPQENNKQKAQLMLTSLRDAFRGQSRSPNMERFDMLGMVGRYHLTAWVWIPTSVL